MPKIVDHDERRREIVLATWRLIARQGFARTTMREIAREAGFANGALTPYFTGKDAILEAAFEHVFASTSARIAQASRGARGLDALRVALGEILPVTEDAKLEARIVLAFWDLALTNPELREIHDTAMRAWRERFEEHARDAIADGGLDPRVDPAGFADRLLVFAIGTQSFAALDPDHYSSERLADLAEGFLRDAGGTAEG